MTDNPTPTADTIRAIAEVLHLAALLDDRVPTQADQGRIHAWATQAQRHNLTRDDLVDGFQAFYDNDPKARDRAIGIADLLHHSRNCKRTRLDREADTIAEARRQAQDARLDEITAIQADALAPAGPPAINTPRLQAARTALDNCQGRDCKPAIAEYHAALKEARKGPRYTPTPTPATTTSPTS